MGDKTKISWTSATWNPLRGCSVKSRGCTNCLVPETRVLLRDGSWRQISDIAIGDELLSFTDDAGTGVNRTIAVATVEAKWETRKEAVSIWTASGRHVTSSVDHLWLSRARPWWRKAENITLSTQLRMLGDPSKAAAIDTPDYQAGYIAGCTAGDGTMRWDPSWRSDKKGFPQSYWRIAKLAVEDAPMLERLVRFLSNFGVQAAIRPFNGGQGSFSVSGGHKPLAKVECRSLGALALIAPLLEERPALAWKAGWLAGFLDTDGSFDGKSTRWSQSKPNDYLDRTVRYAADLGFTVKKENHSGACSTARLYVSSVHERLSFLGAIYPALLRKSTGPCIGRLLETEPDPVIRIERSGVRDLVDITTSTGTFIAEGLATHNCYAMNVAARFSGPGQPYEGLAKKVNGHAVWTGKVIFVEKHLEDPLRWKKPRRIFVNSMSDLFHPDVPDEWIDRIFGVMEQCPQHTFQILTKRPERMREYMRFITRLFNTGARLFGQSLWHERFPNIWLGVSTEDQRRADERIPILLDTPAAVRFLSIEPMLGPVDLSRWLGDCRTCMGSGDHAGMFCWDCEGTGFVGEPPPSDISWVITGGESGPRHRPFNPQWAKDIRDQCITAGVAYFHKQSSGLRPGTGRELDGRLWEQFPDERG